MHKLCLLLGFLLLFGCDLTSQPKLRVGLLVWPPYEFGFLAQKESGLADRIELIDYLSPAVAARDFRSGAIDAVALTTNYALELAATDPSVRIVLAIDESTGGDAIVGRSDIKSMVDLEGQQIGVEASALGAYVLARALAINDMTVSDIRVVPVDLGDQERLFREGDLAAVTTYEPTRSRLIETGGTELFNSADLSGEIMDVLITRTQVIQRQRSDLESFVHGWLRAVELYLADSNVHATFLGRREGLSGTEFQSLLKESAVLFGVDENRRLFAAGPDRLVEHLGTVHGYSLDAGLLPNAVDYAFLVEPAFIRSMQIESEAR